MSCIHFAKGNLDLRFLLHLEILWLIFQVHVLYNEILLWNMCI